MYIHHYFNQNTSNSKIFLNAIALHPAINQLKKTELYDMPYNPPLTEANGTTNDDDAIVKTEGNWNVMMMMIRWEAGWGGE